MTEKIADSVEPEGESPANGNGLKQTESGNALLSSEPEQSQGAALLEETSLALEPEDASLTEQKWQRVYRYGFSVAGLNLLVPENSYCELLTNFRLSRLPNSPEHFLGITNVRGNLIPVYQLEPLCELEPRQATYALIIGELHHGAALVIGDKPRAVDRDSLEPGQPEQTIPSVLSETITEAGFDGKAGWYTLNTGRLFHDLANWVT